MKIYMHIYRYVVCECVCGITKWYEVISEIVLHSSLEVNKLYTRSNLMTKLENVCVIERAHSEN